MVEAVDYVGVYGVKCSYDVVHFSEAMLMFCWAHMRDASLYLFSTYLVLHFSSFFIFGEPSG